MSKKHIDDIRQDLKSAYRVELYQDLYESLMWLHDADPTEWDRESVSNDSFPIFPNLKPKRQIVFNGLSGEVLPESRLRDTANALTLMTAKLRPANIKPLYDGIASSIISDARTGYWSKRCTGNATQPGWTDISTQACYDMLGAGMGFVQIGKKTNRKTGQPYTTLKRHRPLNMLWDPSSPTIAESEWMCPVHILSVEQAERLTGMSGLDEYATIINSTYGSGERKIVQVFEYISYCGEMRDTPTRAFIVGSFESEKQRVIENFDGMIPIVPFEFLHVDGFEFPQGAVYLNQHLEIQADSYRKRLKNIADLHAIIWFNPDMIRPQDMQTIKDAVAGKCAMPDYLLGRRKTDPQGKPFEITPGASVPPGLMELYQLVTAEFRAISGVDDPTRGQGYEGVDTKYEAQLIQQKSGAITGFGGFKMACAFQKLIQKVGEYAALYDTDPVDVTIDGASVTLNDPENPALTVAAAFEQDATVFVAEEELYGAAHDMKTRERIEELKAALMLPGINQIEVTKEIARLMKLDVSVMVPQIDPMMGGMPGQPMPPQGGMPTPMDIPQPLAV